MSDNVTILPVVTKLDVPVERIIDGAAKADLSKVVVIGYQEDGSLYFASSAADGGDVLWLLEKAKAELLKIGGIL